MKRQMMPGQAVYSGLEVVPRSAQSDQAWRGKNNTKKVEARIVYTTQGELRTRGKEERREGGRMEGGRKKEAQTPHQG